jgi:hypothetical protein
MPGPFQSTPIWLAQLLAQQAELRGTKHLLQFTTGESLALMGSHTLIDNQVRAAAVLMRVTSIPSEILATKRCPHTVNQNRRFRQNLQPACASQISMVCMTSHSAASHGSLTIQVTQIYVPSAHTGSG